MRRRNVLAGLGALIAAAAGGVAWKFHFFGKHYPPTPYDDLLNQILWYAANGKKAYPGKTGGKDND